MIQDTMALRAPLCRGRRWRRRWRERARARARRAAQPSGGADQRSLTPPQPQPPRGGAWAGPEPPLEGLGWPGLQRGAGAGLRTHTGSPARGGDESPNNSVLFVQRDSEVSPHENKIRGVLTFAWQRQEEAASLCADTLSSSSSSQPGQKRCWAPASTTWGFRPATPGLVGLVWP